MEKNLKSIEEYLRSVDPFDIPLNMYRFLVNNDEYCSIVHHIIAKRIYELYGDWVKKEFTERRAGSLVVCGKEVILTSKDRYGFSNKQIAEIENRLGKPCYLLSGEALIEERASC